MPSAISQTHACTSHASQYHAWPSRGSIYVLKQNYTYILYIIYGLKFAGRIIRSNDTTPDAYRSGMRRRECDRNFFERPLGLIKCLLYR
jgi:hypothetical protein